MSGGFISGFTLGFTLGSPRGSMGGAAGGALTAGGPQHTILSHKIHGIARLDRTLLGSQVFALTAQANSHRSDDQGSYFTTFKFLVFDSLASARLRVALLLHELLGEPQRDVYRSAFPLRSHENEHTSLF
jgi:hypothetical protein